MPDLSWAHAFPAASALSAWLGVFFGLAIGSFLNVVIYRLPIMLERDWASMHSDTAGLPGTASIPTAPAAPAVSIPAKAQFNLLAPPSACPSCGHKIRWFENIPLLSFLMLKGRCSECRSPIDRFYPTVELLTGLLFGFCLYRYGLTAQGLAWCFFGATLVALAVIDWKTTLLPDSLNQPLLWAGLIASGLGLTSVSLGHALAGAVAGFIFLWLVYWAFKLVMKKEGMGRGDFKLFAALGAWLGWQALPTVVVTASVTALIAGLILKYKGALLEGGYFPFGPFLAAAGLLMFVLTVA